MAALIRHDWQLAKSKVAEWEKGHGSHPTLVAALSERYGQLGRQEDAIRSLKQYIAISPDQWAYRALAEHYKKKGDEAKWQETLEAFLRQEDYGLGHAQVRVELARHFMKLGQWKKAQPYAEAAAQTWARWAMLCASECAEGIGDWTKAEQWMQRIAERYPDAQMDYFLWCKRTGHGDVQKAQEVAEQAIEALGSRATPQDWIRIGCVHFLAHHREAALTAFLEASRSPQIGVEHFLLALVADDLKKSQVRDEALEKLVATKTPKSALAGLLLEALAKERPFDLKAVEAALGKLSKPAAANSCYYVAYVLEKLGRRAEAATYLERCANSQEKTAGLIRTLAAAALRERGIESGKAEARRK